MKKNRWICFTVILLILSLCVGIMPEASAMVVNLQTDSEGGYYYNLQNIGNLQELDLSDRTDGFSFRLYDGGGAEGQYDNNCYNGILITAPQDFVISISGSGVTESPLDFVTVYDGDDTSTVLGSGSYSGTFTMPELQSSENVMRVHFESDRSTVNDGFELTVTLIDHSSWAHITYAYGDSTKTVLAEQGTTMQLKTFLSMFSLPERKLFSCWESGGQSYNEDDTVTVTGDSIFTAVLEDEPVILPDGEGGYYSRLPTTGTIAADLSDQAKGFTLRVYDNGGKNGRYSYGCDGYLLVGAPEGFRLRVNGSGSTYRNYDYLKVFDGDTSIQLGPKFEGTFTMNDYYTSGNILKIYFHSQYGNNYPGFELNVTVVDPDEFVTISFDAGEGSGTMDSMAALPGGIITLPECGFTLPDKTYFDYYTDGTNTYQAGGTYTVSGSATLTAVYVERCTVTYQSGENTAADDYPKGTVISLPNYTSKFTLPYRKECSAWRSDGRDYAQGGIYTVNGDVTFTAVLDALPIVIDDGNGGYYCNLPGKEHVQADLAGYSNGFTFMLYDNGGRNGSYTIDCNGSLTFTAPEGMVFRISGTGRVENNYDLLSICDSDLTTLLGGSAYTGSFTVDEMFSASNAIKVLFTSDGSSNYDGFSLNIMMLDPSTLITVSFDPGEGSGTMNDMTEISGAAFTLPDYGFTTPEGKVFAGYSDGTNVYWPGRSVSFSADTTLTALWAEITGITYAYNDETKAISYGKGSAITVPDFTDVFNLSPAGHFVGWEEKFSGTMYCAGDSYVPDDPTVFTAVFEILQSDGNGGWFVTMPVSGSLLLDLSEKAPGFSFALYDDGGKTGYYSNYCGGQITIRAPENAVLTVCGSGETENNWDYLILYDGASTNANTLGQKKYMGSIAISEALITDGNCLTVYFYSDSSVNKTGFELTVSVLAQTTVSYVFNGETRAVAAEKDSTITLAAFSDLFESPDREFVCWQNGTDTYDAGEAFRVTDDVTFTAVTRPMPTVTFDGNGATLIDGEGETVLPPIPFPTGATDELPHAGFIFNIPEHKAFGGWSCNGRIYAAGDRFTLTEDTVFTAIWRDANAWDLLNESFRVSPGTNPGTITLTEDITAEAGSLPLTVPAGVDASINLNGHTITGTQAASADLTGNMIIVSGSLTFTGTGTVTGGSITVSEGGVFTPGAAAGSFAATVTREYETDGGGKAVHSVTYCQTLDAVLREAANTYDYRNTVTLLKNVTVVRGETLTLYADGGIILDLNGHTFDVRGTITGVSPAIDPCIYVESSVPGVFRSSGTIGIDLSAWTNDVWYITGGTVSGFFGADGGRVHISGGHFTDTVLFNNYNDNARLEIDLYGDAVFDDLEYMIYVDADSPATHMVINDRVRVGSMLFAVVSDGVLSYPALTVNGGYFDSDPRTWRDGTNMDVNAIVAACEPEQYSGQADWEADNTVYPWRVKQAEQETTALVLPASLTVIGESAFENCGASVVYIPDHCTTIGPDAFKDCKNLCAVHIPGSVTVIDDTAFDGCGTGLYIYGERGSAAETFCDDHTPHFRDENVE